METKCSAFKMLSLAVVMATAISGCGNSAEAAYQEARIAEAQPDAQADNVLELYRKAADLGSEDAAVHVIKSYCGDHKWADCSNYLTMVQNKKPALYKYYRGLMLLPGSGSGEENESEAIKLLKEATAMDQSEAATALGEWYLSKLDYKNAQAYYETAVKNGSDDALLPMAKMYLSYQIPGNHEENAFEIINKAAAAGDKKAALMLVRCYLDGRGTTPNFVKALETAKHISGSSTEAKYLIAAAHLYNASKDEVSVYIRNLKTLAVEKNSVDADYLLYRIYNDGLFGQEASDKDAIFYARSSDQGSLPGAAVALAEMYMKGRGTEANPDEAIRILQRALLKNPYYPQAELMLGKLYMTGTGARRNDADAWKLLNDAAESGNEDARFNRAVMIQEGRMPADSKLDACVEFKALADHKNAAAAARYGSMILSGNTCGETGIDAATQAQKQAEARKYLEDAVKKGSKDAAYPLAQACDSLNDVENAILWYKVVADDAANQDTVTASARLGEIYDENGSLDNAQRYYSKAYNAGNVKSGINLARLYYIRGRYADAAELFNTLAPEDKTGTADTFLGLMYEHGFSYRANEIQALEWYDKGVAKGSYDSMYLAGHLLDTGKIVPDPRRDEAEGLLRRAACGGIEDAAVYIGSVYYRNRGKSDEGAEWLKYAQDKLGSENARKILATSSRKDSVSSIDYSSVESYCAAFGKK